MRWNAEMLFRAEVYEGIGSGAVTVAFRSWRRPTVVEGGTLRTPVGVLRIDEVAAIDPQDVSLVDARLAGFETVDDVFEGLPTEPGRRLYRIRFHLEGDDPRIALRTTAELDADDRRRIDAQLDRWDRSSEQPWTRPLLDLIAEHPGRRSIELAAIVGLDQTRFKRRVRQLKELGLTESLGTGYRLSPRGVAFRAG